ncbi:ABC transporter ATP-binding protein [Paracoccus tegillarcae]|uniref:ABC transporter ATP-binding protein n=1 Tax=Paracoccus tegillarcae TaxID=1529068 RepID=A0A2K9ER87_9RHOB|nr:ABC transporter ATP-binding protein [Paracoccus tegillarcae]AUH34205.1 ABC transporter ATP-binding protein [Paracoccus tegillarcae]
MTLRERIAALMVRGLFGPAALSWLTPVLARALPGIALVLATSLTAALIALVPPWLTKLLIDQGLVAQDWHTVLRYAAMAFAVGLLILCGSVVNSLLHLRFSAQMLIDLRSRMLDAALHRRPDRPALTVGEGMARIDGDTAEIQRFAFDTVLAAASSVFRLVGGTVMLFVLDWRLALIPLMAAPINLGFLIWARPRTRERADQLRSNRGELSSYLAEGFAGLPTLRTLGAQPSRLTGFVPLQAQQVMLLLRQRRWSEFVSFVPQLTGALVRTAILLGGGWLVVSGQWQIGALIAFLSYVGMMTGPLQNLLGLYHAQAQAQVALARLTAIAEPDADERGGRAPSPGSGTLRLVQARAMASRHLPVDLTIHAGETVLIDGPSGIGKSTLIALAAGLVAPAPGARVFLDGEDVAGLDRQSLRRAVAVVPQAALLFRGTVADNLHLADPEASDDQMTAVLAMAGLSLTTDVAIDEAGRNLSGGERQRIALARALLLPFRVLVLDECLSEVDTPTARTILTVIRDRFPDRTIIVIAHAGPAREMAFDQVALLRADPSVLRNSRGDTPNQRVKARENAV